MTQWQPAWVDDELRIFQDSVRKIFEREFVPQEEKWRKQRRPDHEVWPKLGELGLLCASIPSEYGGGGGTFAHEAVICMEQARAQVSSFSISVHSGDRKSVV